MAKYSSGLGGVYFGVVSQVLRTEWQKGEKIGDLVFFKVEFWHGAAPRWAGKGGLAKGALVALLKYRVGVVLSIAFSQDLYLVGRLEMPLRATSTVQLLLSTFLSNVSRKYL